MMKKTIVFIFILSSLLVVTGLAQQVDKFEGTVAKVSALMITKGGKFVFDGVGVKLANHPDVTFVVAKKDITRFKLGKKLKGGDYEVDSTQVKGKQVIITGSKGEGSPKEIQVINLKVK